jgi:NAD+ diphosphatase
VTLDGLPLARETVDRAAHRRTDDAWLAAAWADEASRVLVVTGDGVAVLDAGAGGDPGLYVAGPAAAPPGERVLLGVEDGTAAWFAVLADAVPEGTRAAGLRDMAVLLDDRAAGLVVQAVALANWHAVHPCCARCGAPTEIVCAGHLRRCPVDASEHYPRTDPAVIMAVVDGADRLLLARQASWPKRRYSTLAGFVEPGESLENAVRREVLEEVGVRVDGVDYLGSQPWPFPSSLMLGFRAQATTTELAFGDDEIAEAQWYDRDALTAAIAGGAVAVPPSASISRRLIEHWYGERLPVTTTWR